MIRAVLVFPLTAIACLAQFQLSTIANDGTEQPVSVSVNLGVAYSGDSLDTQFRMRNPGPALLRIDRFAVAGTGFSFLTALDIGTVLAAGASADFVVRFTPSIAGSYSAALSLNGSDILLRATCPAAATLLANVDGMGFVLSSGTVVDFGQAEKGAQVVRHMTLTNATGTAVRTGRVDVSGDGFQASMVFPSPLDLQPGAATPFDLIFLPQSSGIFRGTLMIDDRAFPLAGLATDPPLSKPFLVIDSGSPGSAQQGTLTVRLASASRVACSGQVQIQFQPSSTAISDDPAVRFAAGARTAVFQVQEGDAAGHFDGASQLGFQTGVTAGVITFTAVLGDYTAQATMTVAGQLAVLQDIRATRGPANLTVDLAGFDNTGTLSAISFTFLDRSGNAIGAGASRVDVSASMQKYFSNSQTGGAFTLHFDFPVAGSTAAVDAVEVQAVNSMGVSAPQRVKF